MLFSFHYGVRRGDSINSTALARRMCPPRPSLGVIDGLVIVRPIGAALNCGFVASADFFVVSCGGADLRPVRVLRAVRAMAFVLLMCCVDSGAGLGALVFRCVLGVGVFGVGGFSPMYFIGSEARGLLSCIRGRNGFS